MLILENFEHQLRLGTSCSCSSEDLNKPTKKLGSRTGLRIKKKVGTSIEDLSCSKSQHLIAYNSLINLLQDSLWNDTERSEVTYQNEVKYLLTSIAGRNGDLSMVFQFNPTKFVGNRILLSIQSKDAKQSLHN